MVCFPCGSKGTAGHPNDGLQATGCCSAHAKNRVSLNASVSSETVSPQPTPGEGLKECPLQRALSSLRWLRVPSGNQADLSLPNRLRLNRAAAYSPGAGGGEK